MAAHEYRIVIDPAQAGMRLDMVLNEFLQQHHEGVSRSSVQKLIEQGGVRRDGSGALKSNHKVREGEEYTVLLAEEQARDLGAEDIPLSILYEDDAIIVLDKQPGLVVHPAPGNAAHTLVNALLHHTPNLSSVNPLRPGIVHRLDKDTSGVMVVAKTNESHHALARQFSEHTVRKVYCALVRGRMEFDEGVIEVSIGRHPRRRNEMAAGIGLASKEAQTKYRTLFRGEGFSLVELFPRTGRTHQLRVHLAFLGHPILGDMTYGKGQGTFPRLALHARSIGFLHPVTQAFVEYAAPLPPEFAEHYPQSTKKKR
jgi:23S rRNA pseudouridine1911/1915/1917 synthase